MLLNPPHNFDVRFISHLVVGMGKLGVADKATEPEFVSPDLVPFLSLGRWTETFLGMQVREVRQGGRKGPAVMSILTRTGPRVALLPF